MSRVTLCALAALAVMAATPSGYAAEFPEARPPLPGGSRKAGEPNRYTTAQTYNDVLEYYRRYFRNIGGIRWYTVINQPGVRAKHMKSLRRKSKWEGVNISEYGGRVHVYVLMRDDR